MNEMQIWVIALFQLWQNSIHGLGIRIRSLLLCIVRVSAPPWLSAHFTATCINIYTFIHQPRVLIRIIFSLLFWSDNRIWLFLGLNALLNHLCAVFIILKRALNVINATISSILLLIISSTLPHMTSEQLIFGYWISVDFCGCDDSNSSNHN